MHRDEARARRRRHAFAVVDACPTTNLPTHHSCPRTPLHAQASGGREEGLLQADATPRQGVLALKNVTPQGDRDAELRTCPPHSSPLALLRHGKPHSNAEHSRRGGSRGLAPMHLTSPSCFVGVYVVVSMELAVLSFVRLPAPSPASASTTAASASAGDLFPVWCSSTTASQLGVEGDDEVGAPDARGNGAASF